MAGGWSKDGAVQEQIDDSVSEAVQRARSQLPSNTVSAALCVECELPIAEARRMALPGVQCCIDCQTTIDEQRSNSGINRRGSKDSQLR